MDLIGYMTTRELMMEEEVERCIDEINAAKSRGETQLTINITGDFSSYEQNEIKHRILNLIN